VYASPDRAIAATARVSISRLASATL